MATVQGADGTTIDYHLHEPAGPGSGAPAIVLVHGITERRESWDPVIPVLVERGNRVVALDLRGHGRSSAAASYDLGSMAADVGSVIAAEQLDQPLLIGHSLGGAVVSAYASAAPCRGVINVDQPLALGGFKEALGAIEAMLRGTPDECAAAVHAVFDQMVGPLPAPERERIEGMRRPDQEVVLGVWDLVLTSSVEELDAVVDAMAGSVKVPYLSLHGIDPGDDYREWLTSRIATAVVEVWPDHGHYPHLMDVARFVDRVDAFDR